MKRDLKERFQLDTQAKKEGKNIPDRAKGLCKGLSIQEAWIRRRGRPRGWRAWQWWREIVSHRSC